MSGRLNDNGTEHVPGSGITALGIRTQALPRPTESVRVQMSSLQPRPPHTWLSTATRIADTVTIRFPRSADDTSLILSIQNWESVRASLDASARASQSAMSSSGHGVAAPAGSLSNASSDVRVGVASPALGAEPAALRGRLNLASADSPPAAAMATAAGRLCVCACGGGRGGSGQICERALFH